MKKILLILAIALSMVQCSEPGQTNGASKSIKISEDSARVAILQYLNDIDFRINGLDRFKMYQTENIFNLLKLDTMTGQIWQVQWNLDKDKEFSVVINSEDLSQGSGSGTFELYPTKNMFQFILLDQVTGRTWHVQWGMSATDQWIRPIN